ncbi:MFS transporter [Nocardioides insulae]|uniref:MFS transporter n=1 Tax=Nocardioides insulae TaxID=394734 RepID=UPI001FE00CE6|nr:MFS transporter [Nocardioides insulae]
MLTEYPTGARRRRLLAVVVLAMFITAYEGQLAPILSLLLDDLGMSLKVYSLITAASLMVGAVAGYYGGRLVDRFGRVRLLVPFLFLSGIACFAMAASENVIQFTGARILLAFVEAIATAGTAPLVRDFTPRIGRAQAFAFWSWGPVGANFVAAGVAAATLSWFAHAWQSQLLIMGGVSIVGSIVVALCLRDLSPAVRREIRLSDQQARREHAPLQDPGVRRLLRHSVIWKHVLAMSLLYLLLGTMNAYGQVITEQAFGLDVRTASLVIMAFWFANLISSLVAARWSDQQQARARFMVGAGVGASVMLVALVVLLRQGPGVAPVLVAGVLLGVGIFLGAAFGPWMASFSQHAEEIHPDLQGTAWGFNHLLTRLFVFASVLLAPRIADHTSWTAWTLVLLVAVLGFTLLVSRIRDVRAPSAAVAPAPEPVVGG